MTDRTSELRHALVATADAAPYQRRRPRASLVVSAIAAFALVGAATGGAVASTLGSSDGPSDEQIAASGLVLKNTIVGTHAQLFGTEYLFAGRDTESFSIGTRPDGAATLAFGFDCLDVGDFTMLIDDDWQMGMGCTDESAAQTGGGGSQLTVTGDGPHTLTISGTGSYIVWAQWSTENPVPPSSAAQNEAMADGVVTREEYVAGFDRFNACMVGAGYHVDGGNREATIISYAISGESVDDGTDRRCYEPEFMLIDTEWQIAHEDESETTDLLRACLTARGIVPLPTRVEIDTQLADNGIDVLDCLP